MCFAAPVWTGLAAFGIAVWRVLVPVRWRPLCRGIIVAALVDVDATIAAGFGEFTRSVPRSIPTVHKLDPAGAARLRRIPLA